MYISQSNIHWPFLAYFSVAPCNVRLVAIARYLVPNIGFKLLETCSLQECCHWKVGYPGRGRGVLPYICYTSMCHPIGYGLVGHRKMIFVASETERRTKGEFSLSYFVFQLIPFSMNYKCFFSMTTFLPNLDMYISG